MAAQNARIERAREVERDFVIVQKCQNFDQIARVESDLQVFAVHCNADFFVRITDIGTLRGDFHDVVFRRENRFFVVLLGDNHHATHRA